jgi:signal transduction histidine kinase
MTWWMRLGRADRRSSTELTMALSEHDDNQDCFEVSMAAAERRHHILVRIVDEQATVRRTATLVAHGLPPEQVFREVAAAVGSLHEADYSVISRYEPDQSMSVVAFWAAPKVADVAVPAGLRWRVEKDTTAAEALRGRRPVRGPADQAGHDLGGWARSLGIEQVIAIPIKLEEEIWGELAVLYRDAAALPNNAEQNVANFVELIGCTIAQAESRAELIASRARLAEVFDTARRSLERDLHDGVQQRLISLGLQLREAQAGLPAGERALEETLGRMDEELAEVTRQVLEICHGLHPAILARGGLAAALPALARRLPLPVDFDIDLPEPLAEPVEIAVYYLVAESLTNVVKHAHADRVTVRVGRDDDTVRAEIHDDGDGGADPRKGSGIIGLRDRIEAHGGTFHIVSPRGAGTLIRATIPVQPLGADGLGH